jgi:hypothetical protein
MRSPPNSNPSERSAESSTPPFKTTRRFTWSNAAWRSWASWMVGSIASQPVPGLSEPNIFRRNISEKFWSCAPVYPESPVNRRKQQTRFGLSRAADASTMPLPQNGQGHRVLPLASG